jgi:hypothetical protein
MTTLVASEVSTHFPSLSGLLLPGRGQVVTVAAAGAPLGET